MTPRKLNGKFKNGDASDSRDYGSTYDLNAILDRDPERAFNYKRDKKASRKADQYVPKGYDLCQTPAYALNPLRPYLNTKQLVWEPAAGEGYLVNALYDLGYKFVRESDIQDGKQYSFFDYQPNLWDLIVTNPPYSLKFKWLKRCYELGKPFALLLPVETLGAKTAQDLMQKHGFEVMLLNRRVHFKMPNKGWDGRGSQFPVCWLCWKLLPAPVVFGTIEYPEAADGGA